MIQRTFGRLESFDERSRNFGILKIVKQEIPFTNMWECVKLLDQGNDPYCVGFAGAHQAIATPVSQLWVDYNTGVKFYRGAQDNDEWPGSDYEGSSVLGLLKYWLSIGFCVSGHWAFTLMEERLGISYDSPEVAGTNWATGMMKPDSNGFIHATGVNEGGHAYLRIGNNEEEEYFTILNSWKNPDGTWWGDNWRAKLSYSDAEKLRHGGEALFIQGEKDIGPILPDPDDDESDCLLTKSVIYIFNNLANILGRKSRINSYVERR